MTSPNNCPSPGEIWLAYLHFSDHPQQGKVRPILILESDHSQSVSLVLKITTNDFTNEKIPVHEIKSWQERGLRKPSYVRVDQQFLIPHSDLLNNKPLGAIPDTEFYEIRQAILNDQI